MKKNFPRPSGVWITAVLLFIALVCGSTGTQDEEKESTMANIRITLDGAVFSGKLRDNAAARALLALLPLTLDMSELNGNEKYYNLPERLPTDTREVGQIRTGDLMLYGPDCLVLFYKDFRTSYRYTRLGYIEDTRGLAAALGTGSVRVVLSVEGL